MTPTVLLYDWDNTLADAWRGVAHAQNAVFAAFGMPCWTPEQTRANVRGSLRDVYPALFGADWERARDIFYATLAATHLDRVSPMPGAERLVREQIALPQAVISNKTGDFLRAEVRHLGWESRFFTIIGAGDARADKPDPAPILLALERLGHPPGASVWYIGDTALDMRAARAAGVTAVLLGDAAHDGGRDQSGAHLFAPEPESLLAAFHGEGWRSLSRGPG
jgi:phosphoglycolate phosphatase